ncbi:hypothetical protein LTR62_008467 [Meristemomyces frigidus]|uniref:PH domain-containing protein n=1 Tax=Meristemomyces frigidus TaxID=1508187 RepID=A0AAN7TPI2_9PEZI|nr:hypothetical protein LTR62_008467 [Meristemomyces frigidus]
MEEGSGQKVSRYRSQRRAQQQQQQQQQQQEQQQQVEDAPEVPPIPQDEAEIGDGLARSRLRYHRKQATYHGNIAVGNVKDESSRERPTRSSPPQRYRSKPATQQTDQQRDSPPARSGASDEERTHVDTDGYGAARPVSQGKPLRRDGGAEGCQQQRSPRGELFPPMQAEHVQPSATHLQLDGPPSSGKIRATKSTSQLPEYDSQSDSEGGGKGGCFGLFKRKRTEGSQRQEEKKQPAPAPLNRIEDVPKSAVNSGDRNVLVECGKSKTIFPVTIETTPIDVIKSAATVMAERINPRSAVLLEMFGSVGIQRPLRRYERLRDVMNSWDTDGQNSLLLVDPGTGTSEAELSVSGAPQHEPGEQSWLLSVSQRPGKWEKRLVTLHTSGQISMQKDPNKPQQAENVCHLSDFDIYTPNLERMKKKVKPPKKHCFAVKSQQKAIMFESTQNFVHFFCTNDARTADDFYTALQGWRSWYLVHVLGEGEQKKKEKGGEQVSSGSRKERGVERQEETGHQRGQDSVGSHYQLGSFRPMSMSAGQFDLPQDERDSLVKDQHPFPGGLTTPERKSSTRRKAQLPPPPLGANRPLGEDEPLANLGRRASVDKKRASMDQSRPQEFEQNGLLGRSYSQRQRDLVERDSQPRRQDGFTAGPSLLNGGLAEESGARHFQSIDGVPRRGKSSAAAAAKHAPHKTSSASDLQRNQSLRQPAGSNSTGDNDLSRSRSTREKARPLIDLTPQYREPPQHQQTTKGRGYKPDFLAPGDKLVDFSTSPEDPIGAPPATDWRSGPRDRSPALQQTAGTNLPPQTLLGQQSTANSGHKRTGSVKRPTTSSSSWSPATAIVDENGHGIPGLVVLASAQQGFTGEGLLAGVGNGGGGGGRQR